MKSNKSFKESIYGEEKVYEIMYDRQKIDTMVDGAYKKFKSYYYYDKTILFIKKEIAYFEASTDFENRMEALKKNLYEENQEYFDDMLKQLDYVIMPKKMRSKDKVSSIVYSDIEHHKEISKINFFVKLPLELYIIDTLWMLLIGKMVNDIYGEMSHSYAGKFKKSIFSTEIKDVVEGIDFNSNRCFKPYFQLYGKWRDNALKTVKKNNNKNTLILGMDLKAFYYSVEFDFKKLDIYLRNDIRLKEVTFLTNIIQKIYSQYTKLIRKYRNNITTNINKTILPIGTLSSIILRELYLREFDFELINQVNPLYYGRYVDDILFVIEDNRDLGEMDINYYINKYLVNSGLFYQNNEEIKCTKYPELVIQKEKMTCFYFEKNNKDILIEAYYEQLEKNSSEAELMPDMDLLKTSFYSKAYQVRSEGGSKKIRDIKSVENNNYNVAKYMGDLKRTLKNTTGYGKEIEVYLEQILFFYRDSVAIEYMSSWTSLFELFVICSEKEKANEFYLNVKQFVEKIHQSTINVEDIIDEKKEEIVSKIKNSIMDYLIIALSLAIGLDYNCVNSRRKDILELARKFRQSNLINHQMVYFPLINYTNVSILEQSSLVCNVNIKNVMNKSKWEQEYALSSEKIKWSPRFIHLNEICLWYFFCYFKNYKDYKIEYIYQQFLEDNNLIYMFENPFLKENPILEEDPINNEIPVINWISIANEKENKVRVAIVNTYITENDCLNALDNMYLNLNFDKKKSLYKILNTAVEENVDYIVFPEFYLPYLWLDDLMKFAKQNNLIIITGLQYLTYNNQAYNFTVVISGIKSKTNFRNSILIYREKNYYAPDEKVLLAQKKYTCADAEKPCYFILQSGKVNLSVMLCYEFTDISSRAALKKHINFLFVPQMNPDTHYFSSIVESTARDLYAFVIQANTSKYGDSRITAPAKTNFREIVQVKGGVNDAVLIGEIDIGEFEKSKRSYTNKLKKTIDTCLDCKIRECEKCEKKIAYKHKCYKGVPPRYFE